MTTHIHIDRHIGHRYYKLRRLASSRANKQQFTSPTISLLLNKAVMTCAAD